MGKFVVYSFEQNYHWLVVLTHQPLQSYEEKDVHVPVHTQVKN